jgi:PAS domain S-box-containing protein
MFESSPLAINITRGEDITYANASYLKMFGLPSIDELRHIKPLELFAPEWHRRIRDNIELRATGVSVPESYEVECLRKDGTKFPVLMYLTRITFVDGPATIGVIMDITERKRAEAQLKRYQLLSENTRDIIPFVRASDGQILEANNAASEAYGYDREELMSKSISDVRAPVTIGDLERQMNDASQDGISFETQHRHRDGSLFPVEVNSRGMIIGGDRILLSVVRDISERKLAEEALRESEDRYRHLFDASPDGVVVIGSDGRITRANITQAQMFRYDSADEMIGVHATQLVAMSSRDYSWQIVRRRLNGEDIPPVEYELVRKDGTTFYGETTATIQQKADGTVSGYICVTRDTTERKRVEKRLVESEQKFRASFMTGLDAAYIATLEDGLILEANSAFGELFGYSREEFIGRTSLDLGLYHDPTDRAKVVDGLKTKGFVKDIEVEGRKKTGEVIIVSLSISTLLIEDQKHILGIIRDITDRKQAEEALRESEERFRALFEQAAVGVALLETKTGRYIRINQKYCDIVGYTIEEMLNKTLQDLTYPDDIQTNLDGNASLIAGTIKKFSLEKRYVRKDGTIVWGNLTASPLWMPDTEPGTHFHIAVAGGRGIAEGTRVAFNHHRNHSGSNMFEGYRLPVRARQQSVCGGARGKIDGGNDRKDRS